MNNFASVLYYENGFKEMPKLIFSFSKQIVKARISNSQYSHFRSLKKSISQQQIKENLAKWRFKKALHNKQFTIISNNCWGARVYQDSGLPYFTPFVGLFLFAPDYIRLLKNLSNYLENPLKFTHISKYEYANEQRKKGIWNFYPIGILDKDIEIHFMHYSSALEAEQKWTRRLQRIYNTKDKLNLFVKFCDLGLCTPELVTEFNSLDFPNKVCFTAQEYPDLEFTTWIKECQTNGTVFDGGTLYKVSHKYFDIVDWLNGGSGKIGAIQKTINTILYS